MPDVATGELLHLRLFMEGVEIPVISTTVTIQPGSPATAQIEIVPTDEVLRLLPRTTVHLFYLDYERADHDPPPKSPEDLYNLLFMGEVFSVSYTKSGYGQRNAVLQCLDFSNIWDTSYLYNMRYDTAESTDEQGNAFAGGTSTFGGFGDSTVDNILNHPDLVIANLLSERETAHNPALQDSRQVLGGLLAILELIGGVQGLFFGVNAWATIEERRVRLMDQIGADSGETAAALYEQSVFREWMVDRIGGAGALISFRDLIYLINRYIYYDIVPNPVGRYIFGTNEPPKWEESGYLSSISGVNPSAQSRSGTAVKDINTGAVVLDSRSSLDPYFLEKLNEVEIEMAKKWNGGKLPRLRETSLLRAKPPGLAGGGSKHFYGHAADLGLDGHSHGFAGSTLYSGMYESPTQKLLDSSWYARMHIHLRYGEFTSPATQDDLAWFSVYKEFFADLGAAINKVGGLRWGGTFGQDKGTHTVGTTWSTDAEFKEFVFHAMGVGWDPIHVETSISSSTLQAINADNRTLAEVINAKELDQYKGVSAKAKAWSVVGKKWNFGARERLITQIFRPDVWFVSPPVCNIIFPDEYMAFSYNRQMMRETSRLRLQSYNSIIGESAIVSQFYFAPDFQGIESLTEGGIGTAATALIYPHEKHSGIVPKVEHISDVSFYSKAGGTFTAPKNTEEEGGGSVLEPGGFSEVPDSIIDAYASRVAAYKLLSDRYQARFASVSAKFTPRLVCGWPALVLSRPRSASDSSEPTHFLGMINTISHSISQGGGATSITLSHARSHKLGDDTDELFETKRHGDLLKIQESNQEFEYHLDIPDPPDTALEQFSFFGGLGEAPLFSYLSTEAGKRTLSPISEQEWRLLAEAQKLWEAQKTRTPIPDKPIEGLHGGLVSRFEVDVTDDPRMVIWAETGGARHVYETNISAIKVYETVTGVIPLEEAIMPPWFSEEYKNSNIGKLYSKLFGCVSITDIQSSETGMVDGIKYTTTPIEYSAGEVSREYTQHAKENGAVPNSYIYGTTARSYATIPQVLHSFHAAAVGGWTNLEGLGITGVTLDSQTGTLGNSIGDDVAADLDPRKSRRDKVLAYLNSLLSDPGLRG